MDAALRKLLDTTSTGEFEDFGSLSLIAAEWTGNDIRLRVAVHQPDQVQQRWRVDCPTVRAASIQSNRAIDSIALETEHPLLWRHVSPMIELYIHGRPSDADRVVGQLVNVHRDITADWYSFSDFLNPNAAPSEILRTGFGKLAEGPKPLMEAYAPVLRSNDVSVSSPPERRPKWWDGERWIEETQQLYLLLLGDTYVIGPSITAEQESPR